MIVVLYKGQGQQTCVCGVCEFHVPIKHQQLIQNSVNYRYQELYLRFKPESVSHQIKIDQAVENSDHPP